MPGGTACGNNTKASRRLLATGVGRACEGVTRVCGGGLAGHRRRERVEKRLEDDVVGRRPSGGTGSRRSKEGSGGSADTLAGTAGITVTLSEIVCSRDTVLREALVILPICPSARPTTKALPSLLPHRSDSLSHASL